MAQIRSQRKNLPGRYSSWPRRRYHAIERPEQSFVSVPVADLVRWPSVLGGTRPLPALPLRNADRLVSARRTCLVPPLRISRLMKGFCYESGLRNSGREVDPLKLIFHHRESQLSSWATV